MSQIETSEHVFIAGMTGSGKTFLAEQYLNGFKNVVVLDTKGFFNWDSAEEEIPIYTTLEELIEKHQGDGKAIYRPIFQELNQEYYNMFLQWIYRRQNTIVVIDELMEVAPSPRTYPEYLKGILTRGRQLNIGCWCLTQRPKDIPMIAMSEATHFFIFRLQLFEDRERIAKVIGYSEVLENAGKLKDFIFWYFNTTATRPPVRARLKIKNKNEEVTTYETRS
jgi:DNA helicase HerA-like ATPase